MALALEEIIAALDAAYPRSLAEPWDTGVGLTCGDPAQAVTSVLLAVDVDPVTVAEAREIGAQLLVTHHPLLFRAVHSVAADTDKGALLHPLIREGIAHFAAHTNADRARGGVNDALAAAVGLVDTTPLVPADPPGLDKLVVFVPRQDVDRLVAALAAAGAGSIGRYTDAAFVSLGEGRFRPMPGAHPAIGSVGEIERVAEARIDMVLDPADRNAVVQALRRAHPYEEPAFEISSLQPVRASVTGLGRVGSLSEPMTLAAFTRHVAERLPATVTGVDSAGDPTRIISTVAVCGGAGAGELGAATRSGADAYVTSDLSHHVVAEHIADAARPAVVRVSHWAGEWPWLERAAQVIRDATDGSVTVTVSTRCTDPWAVHAASFPTEGATARAHC